MARLSQAERTRLWGPPCSESNLRLVTLPWGMRVRVHRLAENLLIEACTAAARESRWIPKRVDSYACRTIRGSSSRSLHSWGLAWDFFATDPGVVPPGGVWKPANTVPADFAACFERLGFTWGRNFSRQDWPHLEIAGPPPGRVQTVAAVVGTPGEYVKPVEPVYEWGEDDVRTKLMSIGPLDAQGNGWASWDTGLAAPVPVGEVKLGPYPVPEADRGYADNADWVGQRDAKVLVQPRGGSVIVTVHGGKPGGRLQCWVSVAPG